MSDPTITRNDDGTLSVAWPDTPRPTYEIAHEALQFMVDDYNAVVERVATLTAIIRDALNDGDPDYTWERLYDLCERHDLPEYVLDGSDAQESNHEQ